MACRNPLLQIYFDVDQPIEGSAKAPSGTLFGSKSVIDTDTSPDER